MNENVYDTEEVRKKFEDLDSELTTFIQSIKEIKEIRSTVGALPEKIKLGEAEIENQKSELKRLTSSTNNVLMTFEEEAKGIIFDLEKKTEALAGEVKSSISKMSRVFMDGSAQLQDHQVAEVKEVSRKYDELKPSVEELKSKVDVNGRSIDVLKNNYMTVSDIFSKLERSLTEMKKNVAELQRRPLENENQFKDLEVRLKTLIEEKHASQKRFSWLLFGLLVSSISFFVVAIYLQQ